MPRNARLSVAILTISLGLVSFARGAIPAPPSYGNIERSIQALRRSGASHGATAPAGADEGIALVDDLRACCKAASEPQRFAALQRLDGKARALSASAVYADANLRYEIQCWLQPRLRLSAAMRRIDDLFAASPSGIASPSESNKARWIEFVDKGLGPAVREYDSAETVVQRQAALDRIDKSLETLKRHNQSYPWALSAELEAAVNELFNQPTIHVRADLATVRPFFQRNIVETGPVRRKQYVSQITAGPKTGFGLLTSDHGVAFYNSQRFTSVTPVWDFHDQLAAQAEGQRAAELYHFWCTTYDWAELAVTAVVSTRGVSLTPCYRHTIDADITSEPTCDKHAHVVRSLASLAGMDQQAINDRVYDGAIARFRERIPREAQEQGEEKTTEEAAKRSAELREQYFVGDESLALGARLLVSRLALGSRPEGVHASGLLQWRGAEQPQGADMPIPARFAAPQAGAIAVVNPGSILTNVAAGALQAGNGKTVDNVMIVTKDVPPGTPPSQALAVTRNVDFATYAATVEEMHKSGTRGTALRIFRPQRLPWFTTDARGYLVGLLHDFQLDVPAPALEARGVIGPPAKIYRIRMPSAEIAASYEFDTPSPRTLRARIKVQDFAPGPGATVLAIDADETKAPSLSRFSTGIVLGALGARLRTRAFELFPDQSPLGSFTVQSVSPLDPSGWALVKLVRVADDSNSNGAVGERQAQAGPERQRWRRR
jgi:hypothetical protein